MAGDDETRAWYQKKRFIIPGVLFALFVIIGVTTDPPEDEGATAPVETTTTTELVTTTTAAPTTTSQATTTEPPPTTTTQATTTTTEATTTTAPPTTTISDAELTQMLGPTAVRTAMQSNGYGHVLRGADDDTIRGFGEAMCSVAGEQDDINSMTFAVMLGNRNANTTWSDEEAVAFAGAAIGVFCPDEFERLQG